jgi:hypothetical protein
MIVDLSRNPVNQNRELREITERKFPLLPKAELIERLEFVVSCYKKAIEIVPERPRRLSKDDDDPGFPF